MRRTDALYRYDDKETATFLDVWCMLYNDSAYQRGLVLLDDCSNIF